MPDLSISMPDAPVTIAEGASTSAFTSDFVESFYTGQTTGVPLGLNTNAAVLEHLAFYTCGSGIISGLVMSVVGSTLVVTSGEAVIGGLVELVADTVLSLPAIGTTNYVFLTVAGALSQGTSSTPPPNGLRIGSISRVGASYVIDQDEYVLKLLNGASWVKVPVLGYPDGVVSSADYVVTLDGIYVQRNGEFALVSALGTINELRNFYLPTMATVNLTGTVTFVGDVNIGGEFYVD